MTRQPEYAARCVSGRCGHTQETRHTRYRRIFADYAGLTPA